MSHWAELDQDNKVIRVLVGDNNDPAGDEGYQWLIDNLGGTWVKTSYNAATNGFRYNFAGVGYSYDELVDAFIPPRLECGHDEIVLTEKYQWDCTNAEHDIQIFDK